VDHDELRRLAAGEWIEIGAHTVTHPRLPRLSRDQQLAELRASKLELERLLEGPVRSFAYPHGAFDLTSVACVREAGFACAVTIEPGAAASGTPALELPRFGVSDSPGSAFSKWLDGVFRPNG